MTQYRTRATLIGARILLSVLSSWIQSPPVGGAGFSCRPGRDTRRDPDRRPGRLSHYKRTETAAML